jgi:hypothetical protein
LTVTPEQARNPRVRGVHRHQVCRIPHRQWPQEDGVQQGENGGVGPDPQSQGKHRHPGEAAILAQAAQSVAQVVEKAIEKSHLAGAVPASITRPWYLSDCYTRIS